MLTKTIATLATLASLACLTQADMLRISNPTQGTTWKTGETVFLQWAGNCASMGRQSKEVDINLMTGDPQALRFVAKLASIDCAGTDTRKEFIMPANVVTASGQYSLSVQTVPELSYSNVFTIETGAGGAAAGTGAAGNGSTGAAGNSGNAAPAAPPNTGAVNPQSSSGSITTAGSVAGVALAAVFFASQLL
ncbi:hypothetical protein DFQ27_003451 [Actinomortierella ambigua]|uniref:Uncharacterized protein n=1 Tax=Actinomortierella ambigua TaxID=1343610 RepID=A0A9P6Q5W3_9FUNG|nr:hypothetical protein DFQ27_003451 [Actinomortierella ambigua]